MNDFIIKIRLFLIVNQKWITIAARILFSFIFILSDLDTLTSCSPTPTDDKGVDACIDAQKLAIEDLNKKNEEKTWVASRLEKKAGFENSNIGTATVIRGSEAYTVQVAKIADKDGTVRMFSDCVRGTIKEDC